MMILPIVCATCGTENTPLFSMRVNGVVDRQYYCANHYESKDSEIIIYEGL